MNIFLILLSAILLGFSQEPATTDHPCSDSISIETRAISPDCNGKDGQIIFSNPDPATATFQWSHDSTETGYNVADLDAGTYSVTVTVGSQVRVARIILE